jgi:hypothetical protein
MPAEIIGRVAAPASRLRSNAISRRPRRNTAALVGAAADRSRGTLVVAGGRELLEANSPALSAAERSLRPAVTPISP